MKHRGESQVLSAKGTRPLLLPETVSLGTPTLPLATQQFRLRRECMYLPSLCGPGRSSDLPCVTAPSQRQGALLLVEDSSFDKPGQMSGFMVEIAKSSACNVL